MSSTYGEPGAIHRPDACEARARAREGERAVVADPAHVDGRRPARAGPALGEELLALGERRGLEQCHRAERPGRELGLLAVDVGQVLPGRGIHPVGTGRQPDDGRRPGRRARDVGVGALHRDVGELPAVVERGAIDAGLGAVGRVGGAREVPRAVAVGDDAPVGQHVVLDAEARAEGHGRAEAHPAVARGGHVLVVVGPEVAPDRDLDDARRAGQQHAHAAEVVARAGERDRGQAGAGARAGGQHAELDRVALVGVDVDLPADVRRPDRVDRDARILTRAHDEVGRRVRRLGAHDDHQRRQHDRSPRPHAAAC